MGRIRTTMVKRTGKKLFTKYPDMFDRDFQANKEKVTEVADIPSKKLRNLVAGYLCRLKKTER